MAVSEQTQRWLMHACTNDFPSEDLTNNDGWPKGMMGPARAQKLKDKGINNFRQLMQQAVSMEESRFKREFGGNGALDHAAGAFWEVLTTWHHAQLERTGQKIPQTQTWLMWADNHDLPAESLKQREGWPEGMLGEIRVAKLESQGVSKTSQLMNMALAMTQEDFVREFGGKGGALDNRAAAFHAFLRKSAQRNGVVPGSTPTATSSPNLVLIAVVLLLLAAAYKFVA
jgi:hypothetical protein